MASSIETTSLNAANESASVSRDSSRARTGVYETTPVPAPETSTKQLPRTYETVDALDFHRLSLSDPPTPPRSQSGENAAKAPAGGSFWKRASQAELDDLRMVFREAEAKNTTVRNTAIPSDPFSATDAPSGGFAKVRSETEALRERPRRGRALSDDGPRSSSGNFGQIADITRSNTVSHPTIAAPAPAPLAQNYSPMLQLEREFLEHQKEEALKLLNAHDWKKAEELICELLSSPLMEPREKDLWVFRRAHVLLILGYWSDLYELVGRIPDESGRVDHCLAEAHYCSGNAEEAEEHCAKAMEKCGRARAVAGKTESGLDPEDARWNELMSLMADIMEAAGKKTRSQFFRSKLPEGFVSRIAESRGGDVREVLRHANEVLEPLSLRLTWARQKFTLSGEAMDNVLNHFRDAMKDRNEIMAWALSRDTTIASFRNKHDNGYTALHYAAFYNNLKYIQKLVSVGADVHAKDSENQWTPLHLAVTIEYTVSTEALLANKASVLISDVWGFTPMHVAAARDNVPMIRLLYDADHNCISKKNVRFGYTPLDLAMMYSNPKAADCLLELGGVGSMDDPGKFEFDFENPYSTPTQDMLREMKALYASTSKDKSAFAPYVFPTSRETVSEFPPIESVRDEDYNDDPIEAFWNSAHLKP